MTDQNSDFPENILEDDWMIRPCQSYEDEYKECKSIKGRFHQHYIYGANTDCTKWTDDLRNCLQYRKHNSVDAALQVIANEHGRRADRLTAAKNNDTWEYRKTPPADWSSPLPEGNQTMTLPELKDSRCVIS